uniref:Dynein heavy chain 8, axonemal-like n=1 Tax=Phallusia mammillata TaxID=59560 RepID=A0A6F9DAJ5_9ASCI|nr:dynein heavy chain 8, axonemal-like [Phallusia mammillata]
MKSGPHSRSSDKTGAGSVSRGRGGGRTSVLSLPISLLNLVDDPSPICLLKDVEKIFSDLEHHQMELTRMQSNSAIGSFLDEVTKWQKRLHLIEAVLEAWVNVQSKWVQLDEIYSGADVRTALAHEANMFAVISKDFRLLMRATEKNTNVLQGCSRKGLLPMLEKMDFKMEQCRHALLGNLERRRQRFPRFYFLSPEDVMNIVCYGYDLNAVNKYLCKVLPHLGRLVFTEQPLVVNKPSPGRASAGGRKRYKVTGVSSTAGEVMTFHRPLIYEGPMSLWLPQLLMAIQATLQEHLHVSLGNDPRPAQIQQTLRSVGASRVRISRPSSAISQRSGGSDPVQKVAMSPTLQPQVASESDSGKEDQPLGVPPQRSEVAAQLNATLGGSIENSQVSWTLDNSTQVVLLATTVKLNNRMEEALKSTSEGDHLALVKVADDISDNLHAAVIMLKGIEDERMVHTKSAKKKVGSRGREKDQDEGRNLSDGSDSIGAPSTKSMLDDDMDIGEDSYVDDAMVGESGRSGPINTMQSLLFTEQVRSGSRGTRGDVLDGENARDGTDQDQQALSTAPSDGKLLLFPSQIRKISGLIGLLTQQRDLCYLLRSSIANQSTEKLFDWEAHLKHVYTPDDMGVKVQTMTWNFDYGFEYQGSCQRYVVTPSCDRVLLSMCQALQSFSGVAISSSSMAPPETLSELSYQLGRGMYSVLCTQSMDHFMLGDLFKGIAETGCWICLQRFNTLRNSLLSVAGQLASEVQKALRAGKSSITLMSEDIDLSPTAACFVTLDPVPRVPDVRAMLNRSQPSVASSLPEGCVGYFRIVYATQPDRRTVLEIHLLSQGFTQAHELSRKLCHLLDLCGSLLSTIPANSLQTAPREEFAAGGSKLHIMYGDNAVTSLPLIEHVIAGAGVSLDVLMREQLELKQEYRDMITQKTRKFTNIWKHRSSLMSSSGGLAASSTAADDSGAEGGPLVAVGGPLVEGGLSSSSQEQSLDQSTQEAIQISKDRELIESDAENMKKIEEIALITALRNILLPRLPGKEERSLLFTFVTDLFPAASEEVDFVVDDEEVKDEELMQSMGGDMNLEISIPEHRLESDSRPFEPKPSEHEPINDVEAAVAVATAECGLSPAAALQNKTAQLAELAESMRSVIVCGDAGCGKSRCIDVYAETQRQLGFKVTTKKVFVNAVDSRRKVFGYFEPEGREWKDGLIQQMIRPHCVEQDAPTSTGRSTKPSVLLLHVDGRMEAEDADIFLQLLRSEPGSAASGGPTSGHVGSSSWLSLPNNERLNLPLDLRVIWEAADLSCLAPNLLSQLGVLGFSGTELSWDLHLTHWLKNLSDVTRSFTHDVIMRYLPRLVTFFNSSTTPPHLVGDNDVTPRLRQTVRVSTSSMTCTFCKLLDCLLPSDSSPVERERYVAYGAFWAFGGTLEADSRELFSSWWCRIWPNSFPTALGDPWRQFVDAESRNFVRWEEHLPQFSGSAGGSGSVFVHTPDASQLMHLIGALMDAGHASMLAGPLGCGKSAIVRERVNNVSSGEVAEVLSLFVHCNRLTEAGNLWTRITEHLEWKHGVTFTPRGNKKLLCMVDDLNLARSIGSEGESPNLQSACELVRQHLDVGGVRNPVTYKWQQVSNTAYVTTINPRPFSCSNVMSQRMTRHFSVFSCPYPSVATQHSIFSTLIQSRLLLTHGGSPTSSDALNEKPMETLLSNITIVTVELQERLRGMYLRTPERAHYTFALGDLEKIFRNLMTSLAPGCRQRELLLLWRHECDWTYMKRMVSNVDCERYQQAMDTSVRKYLTENKFLSLLLASKQPLFSSVRELESGIITAGRNFGRNSSNRRSDVTTAHVTDYYKVAANQKEVHDLLLEALKEYNKVNVKMRLNFYDDTIKLICRASRILQSSQSQSHSVMFGDGCPAMAALIVNISAHLGGFRVVTLPPLITPSSGDSPHHPNPTSSTPASLAEPDQKRLQHFKRFLVQLYNNAGVKGQKIVFILHDDKELNNECLTVIEELVCYGAISHLFTPDEQTTIANSVRSEVTAAGLTYSKEVAWHFFLTTVRNNLRIVLICSNTGDAFMEKSLEFPSLFSRMNMIALHHWNREQLVTNALYHFNKRHGDVTMDDDDVTTKPGSRGRRHVMDKRGKENVAHLLANMHMLVRIRDDNKFYRVPGHVSNYAYEKLVERFVHLYRERRQAVKQSHLATRGALENIDRENSVAEVLQKDLDREQKVLEEHRAGTLQLLAQIGQDMVITEQQVSAVKRQIKRIRHLKKTLPEYQLAHEKAIYKTTAIVADTKKVVQEIDVQALQELRSLQKPDAEVEDMMAAIIMILKSPNSDVSWSKGAKRQMANLDRFLDELMSFDEMTLPLATLENLESFLEKETFAPEVLTQKAGGNPAAGSLVKWVQGVFRYHTTLISKVKPLHEKVEETSVSIGDAQHKLRQLESKKEALEARLRDLADGFEQATADKNTQVEKRSEMEEHLRVAAQFRQILAGEHRRCCGVLNTYEDRLDWVTGAAAVSSGFATYLSAYPYALRRMILTRDWPVCLADRGVPLVFDSIDPVNGHVIEFMLDVNENIMDVSPRKMSEGDAMLDAVMATAGNMTSQGEEEGDGEAPSADFNQSSSEDLPNEGMETSNQAINTLPPVAEETDADDEADDVGADEEHDVSEENEQVEDRRSEARKASQPEIETTASKISQGILFQPYTVENLRFISQEEYQSYLSSLIKVLVGEDVLQEWKTKGFAHHQLQNAAVMLSSWQRPPLLLDPYLTGVDWCAVHLRQNRAVTPVNLAPKIDSSHVTSIEKSVLGGNTLILMDCEHHAGALVRPLIHYANTAGGRNERSDESQTVRFLGRRLVCPDTFRLYLTTTQMTSARIHPDVIAATQLISYVSNAETLQEDLLLRALMRIRPDIYRERRHVARAVRQHRHTLAQLDSTLCERLVTGDDPKTIENSTKFLSNVVELKAMVSHKLEEAEQILSTLNNFTEELYPIAQRAAMLHSICRAIPALNIHYQIPLPFFLHLFDTSVGDDFEDDEAEGSSFVLKDIEIIHGSDVGDDVQLGDAEESKRRREALARRKASLRLGSASHKLKKGRRVAAIAEGSEDENEEEIFDTDSSDKQKTSDSDEAHVSDEYTESKPGEGGSHVIVPEVTSMRGEDQDFGGFPSEKVKQIVDELTKRVFANLYGSVHPEHRILITTLTLLNIQMDAAEPPFTEEESNLLVHGNPGLGAETKVSLSDFGSDGSAPEWLPADRWEDLLAYSVLPGALEGICVHVAEDEDHWKSWYELQNPEKVNLPSPPDEVKDDKPELTDFQRLLLIKTLRPDRFEPALYSYVTKYIGETPLHDIVSTSSPPVDAETLFRDVTNTLGILVLLPDDDEPEVTSRVSTQPADAIRRLAEKLKVTMETVTLGDGYQQEATRCIDSALSQDSWALIHGLHLAPEKFFEDLQIQLARVGNVSRNEGDNGSTVTSQGAHFQVWMTSKSHASLPSLLTQYLYKMSWDSLLQLVVEDRSIAALSASTCSILKSCLISTFSQISTEVMTSWSEVSGPSASLLYAVPICHAFLLARQCFGWHGNHENYPIKESILNQALLFVIKDKGSVASLKQIYTDVITTNTDQIFMERLFDDVIEQIGTSKNSVQVDHVTVPVPPSNVPVNDIASWLRENIPDALDVTSSLSLPKCALSWRTSQRGERILTQMQNLFNAVQEPGYESTLLSPGSTSDVSKPTLTLIRLQNVLDACAEKLPPLLELGDANQGRLKTYDFPYHRPSVISTEETGMPHMPESIGFVLLQECIWFNRCVCMARQQLHDIRSHLFVTSDYQLAPDLRETAVALYHEEVPLAWQHPNEIPNTHVLLTWLDYVTKKYMQMRSWVKTGMVPVDGKTPVGPVTSIWLGGLVNPGALLMALCTEAVAAHETTHDQIRISCKPVRHDSDITEHTAGMYLENVHTMNCVWDEERGCFQRTNQDEPVCVHPCPRMYFFPTMHSEEEEEQEKTSDDVVEYPVYVNMSRQCLVTYFTLPSSDVSRYRRHPKETARAFDCGLILQDGPNLSQRDTYKSRAYLAHKRREEWSRVSPAVSELMSRSGTRMSSARHSLSGPRMSVTSLPVSVTTALKSQVASSQQAEGPGIESRPQLYPEDTFVVSQKSQSSLASSLSDLTQRNEHQQKSQTRPPLANGDVKHLKSEVLSEGDESATHGGDVPNQQDPPTGDEEETQSNVEPDSGRSQSPDGAHTDPSQQGSNDDTQLEREGSLLQTILDEGQTTEDEP